MSLYENSEWGVDTKDTAFVLETHAICKHPERKVYGPSHFRQEILALGSKGGCRNELASFFVGFELVV